MDSNEQYYKDLVQLFVDGETTEIENEVLFQSLTENTSLQQELQSAVRFGKVILTASKRYNAPPDLYSSVMNTVGLDAVEIATKANPVVTIVKSLVLVSLGALVTLGIVKFTDTEKPNKQVASSITPRVQSHEEGVNTVSHDNNESESVSVARNLSKENNTDKHYDNELPQNNTEEFTKNEQHTKLNKSSIHKYFQQNTPQNNSSVLDNSQNTIVQVKEAMSRNRQNINSQYSNQLNSNSPKNPAELNGYSSVPADMPDAAIQQQISLVSLLSVSSAASSLPMNPQMRTIIDMQETDGFTNHSWYVPRFVSARGMMGIIRTANTIDATALTLTPDVALGDIAIDATWAVSENTSLGIEVGRERLPLYSIQNINGVNTYTLKNNITWAALKYRLDYRPDLLEFLLPNSQSFWWTSAFSAGFSDAGMLLKSQAMLTYNFYDKYHISLGPEFTFQLISNNNSYQSALRSGIGLGIGYEF